MNNSKTTLAVFLMMAGTLLSTTAVTTMVPAAYAGGDNDDGNKQKAEDDSSAAIADCDENEVEQAGFDCFAIATSDVEIEPEEEETATLSVCKTEDIPNVSPAQFEFTVTGNNPSPAQFVGDNSDGCVDVTIGPGEYTVNERPSEFGTRIEEGSDCEQDDGTIATGIIQAGETQTCTFFNFVEGE